MWFQCISCFILMLKRFVYVAKYDSNVYRLSLIKLSTTSYFMECRSNLYPLPPSKALSTAIVTLVTSCIKLTVFHLPELLGLRPTSTPILLLYSGLFNVASSGLSAELWDISLTTHVVQGYMKHTYSHILTKYMHTAISILLYVMDRLGELSGQRRRCLATTMRIADSLLDTLISRLST